MLDGKLGTVSFGVESARGTQHPPVLLNMALKPNQGILPAGLLLEESASGLVPYTDGTLAGVLDQRVDTEKRDSGLVIVHGSAIAEILKVGATDPEDPDETELAALIAMGVYPE